MKKMFIICSLMSSLSLQGALSDRLVLQGVVKAIGSKNDSKHKIATYIYNALSDKDREDLKKENWFKQAEASYGFEAISAEFNFPTGVKTASEKLEYIAERLVDPAVKAVKTSGDSGADAAVKRFKEVAANA
jgi:hypothetical protein